MTASSIKRPFWTGARDSLPFLFVVIPFGTLFGVFATESGLLVYETMTFSFVVFAGASQLTALQLLREAAPTLVVLISALAVNLRCAMYSAALTPYLGAAPLWKRAIGAFLIVDQSYALSIMTFERYPGMNVSERWAYFFGTNLLVAPLWCISTLIGSVAGASYAGAFPVDAVVPIAFFALIGPMLRTPAHLVAALVAIIASILAADVPHNLGLIIGGTLGMIAGATMETIIERRTGKKI